MSLHIASLFPLGINLNEEAAMLTAHQALAQGDIIIVDPATLTAGKWSKTATLGVTSTNKGSWFGFVVDAAGIASGAVGKIVFVGDDILVNLSTNSGLGALIVCLASAKTGTTSTLINEKYIGRTKATGTGLVKCTVDGWNGYGQDDA